MQRKDDAYVREFYGANVIATREGFAAVVGDDEDDPERDERTECFYCGLELDSDIDHSDCGGGDMEDDEDDETGDDLCDLCHSASVTVSRTTRCGKTIGVECGCDESSDGGCGKSDCPDCTKA